MKKRRGDQRAHGLLGAGRRRLHTGRVGQGPGLHAVDKRDVHNVVHTAAVGEARPFGLAGRSRGIKDAGVRVRVDGLLRQRGLARPVPCAGQRQLIPVLRPVRRRRFGPHRNDRQLGEASAQLAEPLQALAVGNQHRGPRIVQRIGHLPGHPPRVHAHHHSAHSRDRPVRQHPLGIVAHRDRHAIPRTHAPIRKRPGQRRDPAMGFGVSDALAGVDQIIALAVPGAHQPDIAQGRRRMPVGEHVYAANAKRLDFEHLARSGEFTPGALEFCVHRWPLRLIGF